MRRVPTTARVARAAVVLTLAFAWATLPVLLRACDLSCHAAHGVAHPDQPSCHHALQTATRVQSDSEGCRHPKNPATVVAARDVAVSTGVLVAGSPVILAMTPIPLACSAADSRCIAASPPLRI